MSLKIYINYLSEIFNQDFISVFYMKIMSNKLLRTFLLLYIIKFMVLRIRIEHSGRLKIYNLAKLINYKYT